MYHVDIFEFEQYLSLMIQRGQKRIAARLMVNHLHHVAAEEGMGSVAYLLGENFAQSQRLMDELEIVWGHYELLETPNSA